MPVSSRALVELVLLGPTDDRRQLQDSPILADVWIAFAKKPAAPVDLLITPDRGQAAGPVAVRIADHIRKLDVRRDPDQEAHVAYLQGLVAARLFFREVLQVIVPMTKWWQERNVIEKLQAYDSKNLGDKIRRIIRWVQADEDQRSELALDFARFDAFDRFAALAAIILWASGRRGMATPEGITGLLARHQGSDPIVRPILKLRDEIKPVTFPEKPQIFQVSLNRKAIPALEKSVPAVKGDAARTLFNVKCDSIAWAVLDSGIDGGHDAFKDDEGNSRIVKAFDFSNIRKIVNLDNLSPKSPGFKQRLDELRMDRSRTLSKERAARMLRELAEHAKQDRPIHWELVEQFVEIDPTDPRSRPSMGHGSHVAGIIGANGGSPSRGAKGQASAQDAAEGASKYASGMCPDIKLYDFRVLGQTMLDTEFAIVAALQYIRYVNERHDHMSIHGVNLSLSIPHDVRNYACGRTPICNECERLVESGVVVVAAAGNFGYQQFETKNGSYEGYTSLSITDPGNAESVITVGATHRYKPHTYGVSFFSSRGPTGDGRLKPDLVAPGERIESALPAGEWGELAGTSMAAPHVSGAAAMLMARYVELIGDPREIKRVLCESATDLGRERSFQGHGMLDVLRAFQKV
jgi:hypothetical protein